MPRASARQCLYRTVFIERLWRSLKFELIYPGDFPCGHKFFLALDEYFHFYNHQRPLQALG
ncbi:MAG: integrase core domain-containing protein [Acidobacteriota bacterium]|jgi:putative transposase